MRWVGVSSRLLAERFSIEKEPSVRAALLLALAENPGKLSEIPTSFVDQIVADYANDPDPGVHSAAFWLLRKWSRLNDALTVDRSLKGKPPAGSRLWYVNREGQTFVIVKNLGVFAMGSPPEENELGRNQREQLHHTRIPRSFTICTREVTVDEFKNFLADPVARSLHYPDEDQRQYSPAPEGPIVSVTWFEAAQYCRWLSDRERIAKDQQCFPAISEIQENMKLPGAANPCHARLAGKPGPGRGTVRLGPGSYARPLAPSKHSGIEDAGDEPAPASRRFEIREGAGDDPDGADHPQRTRSAERDEPDRPVRSAGDERDRAEPQG